MKKKILASMVALALSGSVMAEDTSSSLRGKITDPQGNAAANTKIVIVHVPSGTRKVVTTTDSGSFSARGLRVGGPYTVLIDSDTYADQEYSDIFLQLGEIERLEAQLEAQDDSNTMIITGTRMPMSISKGSGSLFGSQAISVQSGISRDIKDVVRANPLVTILPGDEAQLTIGGMNPKFNSFTVDGISQNDDFGLNSGGFPTQRSPIPLDSLEQITVDVAPFDAKVSGFSGGLINSVFKSGTNEFHGSVFWENLDSKRAGTPVDGDRQEIPIEFSEETIGFNLSGPIIKDTLFFMVSYEDFDSPQTLEFGAAGSGAPNSTRVTTADVAEVQRIAQEVYGLSREQVGSDLGSPTEQDEKYVVKLDWNINDFHRASFSYQFNDGNRTRNTTSNDFELRLTSHWYNVTEKLNNFSTHLYSDWTDKFSTEISFTMKEVENRQTSFGDFADVTIQNFFNAAGERGQIVFGSDRFRHANSLDTATDIIKFDAEYLMDDHALEFGFEYSEISIQNLFVPSSKGVIVFDNIEDFENRQVESYDYANGTGNDPFAVGADFQRQTLAFYVQDNWTVNDQMDVTFGLRYETLSSNDEPPFNQNSLDRTGFDNSENLDGISILLPRVGITYEVNEDLTIRGGIGRFSGGQPNVWISNAYSENGVNSGFFSQDDFTLPANGITTIIPAAFDQIQDAQSDGNVSFTDPNFKLPSDWRFQLAADYSFDIGDYVEDVNWTTELLYIKKQDSAFWVDASLANATVEVLADGQRLRYLDDEFRYDLMLTNVDKDGRSYIFTTQLDKQWENGFSANIAYTYQDITEVNPGTSSTGRSNFRFSDGINRGVEEGQLGTAAFEVKHRYVMNLGYNTELFEGYNTNINLFYERRAGNPFTWRTDFDRNVLTSNEQGGVFGLSPEFSSGDFTSYIPTVGDPNVVFDTSRNPNVEADLHAAIDAAGLRKYEGGFAPKQTGRAPWVDNLDLSMSQEIPGLFDGHKGQVTFIIDNFLNLFDETAGRVFDVSNQSLRLYEVDVIDDQGRYVVNGVPNDDLRFRAEESTWKLKLGVRYSF